MKTKLKDFLLYTFAGIGVLAFLVSATNSPQQTISTVPETHVWEFHLNNISTQQFGTRAQAFAINKVTGEVRKYETSQSTTKKMPFGGYNIAQKISN